MLLVLGIVAFAAADAAIKGHHGGTRNAIGNVSATWALVPFLAAAFVRRPRVILAGAVVGALSTALALGAYAVARASLSSGGERHGAPTIDMFGNRWLLLGLVGGAALGVVGAHLAARTRWTLVVAVSASLLVMEPVARLLWALSRHEHAGTLLPSPTVWAVEIACGCLLVAAYPLVKGLPSTSN